ncbi:unnamed protein product, partial [Pylaiella littoralis]
VRLFDDIHKQEPPLFVGLIPLLIQHKNTTHTDTQRQQTPQQGNLNSPRLVRRGRERRATKREGVPSFVRALAMVKHGKGGSGSGARTTAAAAAAARRAGGEKKGGMNKKTCSVQQPKRRRGAPQTFSSKLFRILQGAEQKKSSPVGWCLDGKSFTVHNDKDFETQVLAANYRHGKFSSFQRQLNMYGFRKVADCSDRTYSHPFFRRDQPDLLAQVRRVVNDPLGSANANLTANGKPVAAAAILAASAASAASALAVTAAAPREELSTNHDGVGFGDASAVIRNARNKTRRCGPVLSPSSVLASSIPGLQQRRLVPGVAAKHISSGSGSSSGSKSRSSSPRGSISSGAFPHPSQHQQARAGVTASITMTLKHQPYRSQHQQQKHQFPHAASDAAAAGRASSPRHHESTSMWHQHTGRWSGATLSNGGSGSLAEDGNAWTTTSSSDNTSVEEATSPVLLPITPADLDCGSSCVPPFRLQSGVSLRLGDVGRRHSSPGIVSNHTLPALVSPASGSFSSATEFGGGSGGGVQSFWKGGSPGAATGCSSSPAGGGAAAASFIRPPSAGLYTDAATALYLAGGTGGGVRSSSSDGGAAVSRRGENSSLPLDKGIGFGTGLPSCTSFDLVFDRAETSLHSNQSGMAQLENPLNNKPSGSNRSSNAVVPASPATPGDATATASAPSGGGSAWDLACLGGPGWGSPDTCESPAAGVWAAIPPLSSMESERAASPRPAGAGDGMYGRVSGAGASDAAHQMYQQQQQQQQSQSYEQASRSYNRNLSATPVFSLTAHHTPAVAGNGNGEFSGSAGVDSLDWVLFGSDGA